MKILIVFLICCGSLFAQQGRVFLKIFYHQYGHYSAMMKEGDRIKIVHYTLSNSKVRDAEFRFDVKPGHQGWIDTDYDPEATLKCSYFVVHLHHPNQLNGASWSRTVNGVKGFSQTIIGTTVPLE